MRRDFLYFIGFWALTLGTAIGSESCAYNLHRFAKSPFIINEDSAIGEIHKTAHAWSAEIRDAAQAKLKAIATYNVEAVPIGVESKFFQAMTAAANQRARAASAFLRDIFSSRNPKFYQQHPEARQVIENSAYFVQEIVGTEMAQTNPWDITLAFDGVLTDNPDGTKGIGTLESDSGAIGGDLRTAWIHQGIVDLWNLERVGNFADVRKALDVQAENYLRQAKKNNGIVLFYTEQDDRALFEPGSSHHFFKDYLRSKGITYVSVWNKDKIKIDPVTNEIHFDNQKVGAVWLRYYPSNLDPEIPSYHLLPANPYRDDYEKAHLLPGFWGTFINGGFKKWHVGNVVGTELFCDKGISNYLPEMIKFYLGEEPLISDHPFELFVDKNGRIIEEKLKYAAENRDLVAVKSRSMSGQGVGVWVGKFLPGDTKKSGFNWNELIAEVRRNPLDFGFQKFLSESYLEIPGRGARNFEFRLITFLFEGKPYTIPTVYIRSAPAGEPRNLSSNKNASVIPVLAPK